jgi:hypothetical protein
MYVALKSHHAMNRILGYYDDGRSAATFDIWGKTNIISCHLRRGQKQQRN